MCVVNIDMKTGLPHHSLHSSNHVMNMQILARSISSVHVGNIITLVLEEALLGNNGDDSTVKPIQEDISNCVIVAKFKTYKYELWRTMFQLPSLVW